MLAFNSFATTYAQTLEKMTWFNEPAELSNKRRRHNITLEKPVSHVWMKAVRRLDAIEVFYSFDDKTYTLMRNCWMQDNTPVQVGLAAASPDGNGFQAKFESFQVKHLPDQRRLEWLKQHAN